MRRLAHVLPPLAVGWGLAWLVEALLGAAAGQAFGLLCLALLLLYGIAALHSPKVGEKRLHGEGNRHG